MHPQRLPNARPLEELGPRDAGRPKVSTLRIGVAFPPILVTTKPSHG